VKPAGTRVRQPRIVEGTNELRQLRGQSEAQWIDRHASGSLRKAAALGLSTRDLYLHERTAHEFGWGFRCLPATRVLVGRAMIAGDCRPLTEACWHSERIVARNPFPAGDRYRMAYVRIDERDAIPEEGVGIVLTRTTARWVPDGHLVFALIAPFDSLTRSYLPAENPC
jgi:hypothetical protein